jgi:hypothetical protein
MAEPSMNFGDMNFQGGIQNFGGRNRNTQNNNYAAPADQVRELLAAIRGRLRELADSAGSARTVAEAAAAIGAIVAAHWPF